MSLEDNSIKERNEIEKIIDEKQSDDETQQKLDIMKIIKVMKYRDDKKTYLNKNKTFEERISEWLVKQYAAFVNVKNVLSYFCTIKDNNYIMSMIDTLFKYHPEKISSSEESENLDLVVSVSDFAKNYIKIKKLQKLIHKPEPLNEIQAVSTLKEAKQIIDDKKTDVIKLMQIKDTQDQNIISYAASNSTLVYKKNTEKKIMSYKYIAEPDTRILEYMINQIKDKEKWLDILNNVDLLNKTALDYAISRSEFKSFKIKNKIIDDAQIKYDKLINLLINKGALTAVQIQSEENKEKMMLKCKELIKTCNENKFPLNKFKKNQYEFGDIQFKLNIKYGRFECNFKYGKTPETYGKTPETISKALTSKNKVSNNVFIYSNESNYYLYFLNITIPIELYDTIIILKPPEPKTIKVKQLIVALNVYANDNEKLLLDKIIKDSIENFNVYERFVFIQLLCYFYVDVKPKIDSDIKKKLKNDNGKINYTKILYLLYFMYVKAKDEVDINETSILMLDKYVPISIFENGLPKTMYQNLLEDERKEQEILKLLLTYTSMENKLSYDEQGMLKKTTNLYNRVELKF